MKKITCLFVFLLTYGAVFGQIFTPQTSGTTETLSSIQFASDDIGYTVGNSGVILKTVNGGTNWNPQVSGVTTDLGSVKLIDKDTVYSCGRAGVILKTTDGGSNWKKLNAGVSTDLSRLFINGKDIYVTGYYGIVLKSSDWGKTWNSLNTGSNAYLYGVYFYNEQIGYVTGSNGTIIKTTNAGSTWSPLNSSTSVSHLFDVTFTDSLTGYVVGGDATSYDGVILKTTNGGASWTPKIIKNNFFGTLKFLNKTVGYVVGGDIGGNTSTILRTNDAGVTWGAETANSKRQFGSAFPSTKAAYTCGLNGTILKATDLLASIFEFAKSNQLVVYPNPTTGKFNIAYDQDVFQKPMNVAIYNVTGDLIYEQSSISEMDLSDFPKGIYYIKLFNDTEAYSKSVLVQ
ncbi:MAG TPA: YCF48-related protein [Bacteroidia bacterium]|jgi:photosystem II stability/assembly factor-like uncharacterized protein|nr:YCF48-related protein [Bacteroidia bacterium]